MLNWSRELERKDPLLNRFLDLNEQYVVGPTGLKIVSGSREPALAAVMNEAWDSWQPVADIASRHSFGLRQSLIVREVSVAGEVFIFRTFGSTGRPRIQLIESERCETPDDRQMDPGIADGVEVDGNFRPLAYWFSDDPGILGSRRTWRRIDADQVIHIFDPSRVNQTRGLPVVYPVLKDLIDLSELQDLEMIAAKHAATTSIVVKNETGELTAEQLIRGTESTDTSTGAVTYYKEAIGAETIVMRPGDSYEQFASERPSVAVQSFWDFVSARAAAGLGLPIEVLIMRSLQGTVARGLYEMAHAYFRCRSAFFAEHFGRIWEHVMANDVTTRNRLPPDFRRIRYITPRSISVDLGYSSKALIDEWRAGFTTLEDIAGARGQEWEQILEQRARELKRAAQVEQDYQLEPGSLLQIRDSRSEPAPAPTQIEEP